MIDKCPECSSTDEFQHDSPASLWEAILKMFGVLTIKRCVNCNASIYLLFGIYITSRRRLLRLSEESFWIGFVMLLLAAGYMIFEILVD